MTYSPYGRIGETPRWRVALYVALLSLVTFGMGRAFDANLYWGIPLSAFLLCLVFIGINWLVRDAERRARLVPYAKWLILAAVIGNIILFVWKHWEDGR